MGIAVMWKYLALALVATATVAALPVTEEHLLDDNTNLIATEDSQVANLQKKLAKLEHTFARIKKSCVANNVPHELGEAMNESKGSEDSPAIEGCDHGKECGNRQDC